jgi:hypothetical protein
MPQAPLLSLRALNRATLARQLLLERATMPVLDAVEHLGGLQAQTPQTWYTGLWTRLERFEPQSVADLMIERRLVRIGLMRGTIHLVTDEDCLAWRPLLAPVLVRGMSSNFGRHLLGLDTDEVVAAGRALLDEQPLTSDALGKGLQQRWPDRDAASLAQLLRAHAALVQVPPRGLWGRSGAATHTTAEVWLGRPLATDSTVDDLALRYLEAFGPASVMDAQAWSGLTRLREVFERLRARLVTFEDEQGRELFDLAGAPRPAGDTPAPVRFLYDYDNLLLSHADRSRFIDAAHREGLLWTGNGSPYGAVLVDGMVRAAWKVAAERRTATLAVRFLKRLPRATERAVAEEGERLLGFLGAGAASRDVAFEVAAGNSHVDGPTGE